MQRTGEVISREFARETLEKNAVLVDLGKEELSRRAVAIYRKAQTALQEGGANTLYLALGFLLWKREEKERRRFRAPLILLPVTLMRKSVRSGVRMLAHDDEPRFNTTLLEMLRKDFSLEIGGLDGALPADERGVDVDGIWTTVRKAVKDAPGFEVTEDVVLGHFSFAKYLMWKDLVDRTEALRSSPVVRHLIDSRARSLPERHPLRREPRTRQRLQSFRPARAPARRLLADGGDRDRRPRQGLRDHRSPGDGQEPDHQQPDRPHAGARARASSSFRRRPRRWTSCIAGSRRSASGTSAWSCTPTRRASRTC